MRLSWIGPQWRGMGGGRGWVAQASQSFFRHIYFGLFLNASAKELYVTDRSG